MRENAKYHTFLNLIQTPFGSNFWERKKIQFPGIISTAVELPKIILGICYGYEKYSLTSGEYVSKKNYGHTTRRSGDNARKLKNISKIASKWGLNEIQKGMIFCIFSHFWVLSLTLNSCRVAKNHFRHMLWVWKTFLDIRGIRQ